AEHYWLLVPLGLSPAVQMRLLSVAFGLGATVAVDRCWARRLPGAGRRWFLVLWVFSPCLLLYSRMGRSYSLQVLVVSVATYLAWRLKVESSKRNLFWHSAGVVVALYTHYVPGLALLAAGSLALGGQRRWRELLASVGLVLAGCTPWLIYLSSSLQRW